MRGDLFGYGETRSGGGRLSLELQAGSARLTAVLDVLVLTSEGRGRNSQTHSLTEQRAWTSCLVLSCLVSSATPAFSLDAHWWHRTSRDSVGVIGPVVFGMHLVRCDLKRFSVPSHAIWHDAAAMFNSLKAGSSPVHPVV
jgi:hypothetical protein